MQGVLGEICEKNRKEGKCSGIPSRQVVKEQHEVSFSFYFEKGALKGCGSWGVVGP